MGNFNAQKQWWLAIIAVALMAVAAVAITD